MKKPRARERKRVWLRRVWIIVAPDGWGEVFLTKTRALRTLRELRPLAGWAGARVVEYRVVEQATGRGVKGT